MSAVLEVEGLRVRYPVSEGPSLAGRRRPSFVEVVHGVSFAVARGETLAVVGESGSGKTTLAMALCGLTPVAGGAVRFDGQVLQRERHGRLRPDRKRLALMFQDPVGSLSPRMRVGTLLAEPFRIHRPGQGNPEREVLRLLDLVGLSPEFARRYPHQLSGGQARRVGVARALALRPDVLVADEPTAGLDVSIQGGILNLLAGLQRDMGLAIVIITHNLNVVRHVADRMAIMYLGRFIEQGATEQVFTRPRHPYTAALLAANPGADPDARSHPIVLQGEVPSLLNRPSGCEFHGRCPRAQQRCRQVFPDLASDPGGSNFYCHYPLE